MADGNNNVQMSDNIYHSSAYTIPTQVFTSNNNKLIYTPKKWEDNELIERIEMNNLEQGIQIALEGASVAQAAGDRAVATINGLLSGDA